MNDSEGPTPQPRPRRFQFRLRTVFLLFFVVAVVLATGRCVNVKDS